MIIEEIQIDKIKPYPKNPRHNDKAIEQVRESIECYGFKQPLVVDKDFIIVAGHTRFYAAQDLNLEKVPVLIADDLTKEQCKGYRIADNKTSEFAEWDMDTLKNELLGLDDLFTGFDVQELSDMLDIDFDPASEDEQGSLETIAPMNVKCPKCGATFDGKKYKLEN